MTEAAAAAPPLRRQPEFLKLWAGQSISVLGDQVSALALPLAAVLTLHASAAQMGVLSAAVWAPHLVFSIAAGAWVDRRARRRRLLVAMDLGRAAALATVPVAYALGALTMAQLYAVAFAVGSLTVVFDVANSTFFPLVVRRDQIVDVQSRLSTSRELRARATGSSRTLTYGVRPLGALAGGAMGALLGLRPALWITGAVLGVVWLLFSPTLAVREKPVEVAA